MSEKNSPWRKRSDLEIDESVRNRDYTGGYEFFPWLWYMRKMYLVGFLGNLLLGWIGGVSALLSGDNEPWIAYAVIGFFGVFAPTLIGYMLRRDYKMLKKGQSS